MTEIQANINESIEIYLEKESYLSEDVQATIKSRFGDEVAARVAVIYNEALDYPGDRNIADMNAGLAAVDQFLVSRYPWLSEKARLKIGFCFMMANK